MTKSKTNIRFHARDHVEIIQTKSVKVVIVCMLLYLIMPLHAVQAAEFCERWDTIDILDGEYRVLNNVWGSGSGVGEQCIEVDTDSTYFSVTLSTHNSSGVASYPFILKGCHWGHCTQDSGLPMLVSDVKSAPFTWSVDTNDAGERWNVAFEAWFSIAGAAEPSGGAELMIWIDWNGGVRPGGSQVGTASIGGAIWDVFYADWNWDYIAYRINSPTSSVSLDFKDFIDDAVARCLLEPSLYLDALEAGFEIWQDGEGLTSNSFSASVNNDEWLYGDFTSDGTVNFDDLIIFSESWLVTDCNNVGLDWNGDCTIDFYEFSLLARNWLEGN